MKLETFDAVNFKDNSANLLYKDVYVTPDRPCVALPILKAGPHTCSSILPHIETVHSSEASPSAGSRLLSNFVKLRARALAEL